MSQLEYSIIVPAYNAADTLGLCLHALLDQTVPNNGAYEVIVVDDGSTDATAEIARSYDVRILSQPHQGPTRARNRGVAEAKGVIVLFTDADCVPVRDWIEQMVKPLADPEIVGVKGAYVTQQRGIIPRFVQLEFEERYRLLGRYRYIDFVDTHAAAFRKAIIRAVGGFDPAIPGPTAEDADLSYRISRGGHKMVFNPAAIVYHRHPTRWPDYLRVKFWRACWRMSAYRKHPGKMVRDSYTPQLLKIQVLLFYLTVGGLGATVLWIQSVWFSLAALTFFFASTLPFVAGAWRKDSLVAALSPILLFSRAGAFSAGIPVGILLTMLSRGRRHGCGG
jgi:cellulose synthase/poly-beta-1,6-N-acetylglucosamine synthase-like glycosyltransferase